MIHILLVIIYLAFISLGLPDSLLGSAWPVMHMEFSVPISYAGAVSMMIAAGTIISSLLSDRLTRKLGTGRVTAISVGMTAAAGRTVFHWHHHRTCYQRLCHLQIQRLADGPHRTHAILSARAAGTDDCHTRAALQEVNTMFADYHMWITALSAIGMTLAAYYTAEADPENRNTWLWQMWITPVMLLRLLH